MTRLAFIGSHQDAATLAKLGNRLHGAAFTAYAPVEPAIGTEVPNPFHAGTAIVAHSPHSLLRSHDAQFDAVVLQGRSDLNPALVQAGLAAGKPLFLNAPIANSQRLAAKICRRCREAPLPTFIHHPLRHLPSVTAVKARLDNGNLGAPGLFRLHCWNPRKQDGTPLIDRLAQELDLAAWLFGQQPARIFAIARTFPTPDYFQVHLGFPGNGMALIDWCWSLPDGDNYLSWSVIGASGAAYADDHHNTNLLYKGGPPAATRTEPGLRHIADPLQGFVDAIGKSPQGGLVGDDGCAAIQAAEAAIESARSGRAARFQNGIYELD